MGSKKQKRLKKQRQRRIILGVACALVICLAFLVTLPILRGSSDISARNSDIVDDGVIRVYLRSLGSPKALGLTLDGIYTVDGDAGFRFAKGTEVTVAEDSGTLYLSAGGLTIDMGGAFTLKRHAAEDNSDPGGIYIHESEKDNLFKGDLRLSSDGRGISSVLSIQVEDYLCGVVAYEMSNSFPLEALKAPTPGGPSRTRAKALTTWSTPPRTRCSRGLTPPFPTSSAPWNRPGAWWAWQTASTPSATTPPPTAGR